MKKINSKKVSLSALNVNEMKRLKGGSEIIGGVLGPNYIIGGVLSKSKGAPGMV